MKKNRNAVARINSIDGHRLDSRRGGAVKREHALTGQNSAIVASSNSSPQGSSGVHEFSTVLSDFLFVLEGRAMQKNSERFRIPFTDHERERQAANLGVRPLK